MSSQMFEVIPITIPSGMAAPTRVTHTLTSITMQWKVPQSDGDSEVYRYDLFAKADFESEYYKIFSGMALQASLPDLLTGFYYQFKVRSVNALGASDFSSASTPILTALEPDVPTNLTLVSRSDSEIEIKWLAPKNQGGIQLSGFNIYVSEEQRTEFLIVASAPSATNPTVTSYTHTTLVAGATFRFKVSAVNFVGEG